MDRVTVTAPSSIADAPLYVLLHNTCGWTGDIFLGQLGPDWSPSPAPAMAYPNPVSDNLNVEIDEEAIALINAGQQAVTNGIPLKVKQLMIYACMTDRVICYVRQPPGAAQYNLMYPACPMASIFCTFTTEGM